MSNIPLKYNLPLNRYGLIRGALFYLRSAVIAVSSSLLTFASVLLLLKLSVSGLILILILFTLIFISVNTKSRPSEIVIREEKSRGVYRSNDSNARPPAVTEQEIKEKLRIIDRLYVTVHEWEEDSVDRISIDILKDRLSDLIDEVTELRQRAMIKGMLPGSSDIPQEED